ncbi:MAG: DUF721 domain-containing protein [Desulfuromonadales bacterium]|nr:DUF721 domain-containing protein [Chloroflexota bacterium]MCK4621017.1 DUF721 domain-containing protein [Desulfuromonadales bacterium]
MNRRERPPMKQAAKVANLLKQVLGDKGLEDRLSRYQTWLIWDKLVGEQIALRARPLRFRQGVLEVQVDHPVWMQQLQMLKPKILEKLNQQLPNAKITDIYLRKARTPTAKQQPATEPEAPEWRQAELNEEEIRGIEEQLKPITDPELRTGLHRLITLQKRLNKGRQG